MKSYKILLLFFLSGLFISGNAQSLSAIIMTEGGKVEGTVENGIKVYKGIPFAAPPVGELRWKAPQPVKSWEGVKKADKFAPGSIQNQKLEQSEDCLYLNIWTTANSDKEKLPVMVWIHGGGFSAGAPLEPTYFGQELTHKGVIFVSIAYRLGTLGFFAHPDLSAESPNKVSGNYGLLDMIEALKWVRKNISAFGGDPAKVTIFGESAGAIAISMLCASPLAKGLFWGAISESGGSFGPVGNTRQDGIISLKGAENAGVEFMKQLGVNSLAELRKMDPQEWFKSPAARMSFWPNADGYVIPDDQYKLYEAGKFNDINVMVGTNSDEGAMFARPIEPDAYKKGIEQRFGDFSAKILKAFPGETKEQAQFSTADIFTATAFAWPSWAWARLQSRNGKSKVFLYYFNQQQPKAPFMSIAPRGAQHAAEIKYVLKTMDPKTSGEDDLKLSELMATYWTNFAKYGDPNGKNLPLWSEFKEKNSSVMYLNSNSKQGPVPNLDKLELMEQYFKYRRDSK
jgi:para-nitrobenzyl esterase